MKNMRWKRGFLALSMLLILLVSLVLAGCSDGSTPSGSASDQEEQQTYKVIYNSSYPKNVDPNDVRNLFLTYIEENSGGRIIMDCYWSGSLVASTDVLDALAAGTIDIADAMPSAHGDQVPSALTLGLPFFSDGVEEGYRLLTETEIGSIIEQEYDDYGIIFMGYENAGDIYFFLNKPVSTVAELKTLKVRSSGSLTEWYDNLGMISINISFAELYDSLSKGIIDGCQTNPQAYNLSSLYEVAKYMLKPAYQSPGWSAKLMSKHTLEKLPDDLIQIILDAEQYACDYKVKNMNAEMEKEIETAISKGMQIISFNDEETAKFKASAAPLWGDFAQKNDNCAKIVEILRNESEQSK